MWAAIQNCSFGLPWGSSNAFVHSSMACDHRLPKRFPVSEMSRFKRRGVKIAIGSVVLVIAGVVLARLWCPSAAEQANAITMEEIEREARSYENQQEAGQSRKGIGRNASGLSRA